MKKKIRILSLRRGWADQPLQLKGDKAGIAKISELIAHAKGQGDRTYKWIGREASVSPSTVSRLARGITRSPHFRTVVFVLNSLGYHVTSHATQPERARSVG